MSLLIWNLSLSELFPFFAVRHMFTNLVAIDGVSVSVFCDDSSFVSLCLCVFPEIRRLIENSVTKNAHTPIIA